MTIQFRRAIVGGHTVLEKNCLFGGSEINFYYIGVFLVSFRRSVINYDWTITYSGALVFRFSLRVRVLLSLFLQRHLLGCVLLLL